MFKEKFIWNHIDRIRELQGISNESQLEIYDIMSGIKIGSLWKKKGYYGGEKKYDYNIWSKKTFRQVLVDMSGWSSRRFESIESILKLEAGRELFIKYGYERMVTYKNHSKSEREKLLVAVETHVAKHGVVPIFNYISKKIFPKRKTPIELADVKGNIIQENKRLKAELKKERHRVKQLEAKIKELEEIIAGLKKAMAIEYLSDKDVGKE